METKRSTLAVKIDEISGLADEIGLLQRHLQNAAPNTNMTVQHGRLGVLAATLKESVTEAIAAFGVASVAVEPSAPPAAPPAIKTVDAQKMVKKTEAADVKASS